MAYQGKKDQERMCLRNYPEAALAISNSGKQNITIIICGLLLQEEERIHCTTKSRQQISNK